ncbi:MAG: hypothetical protein ISQ20_09565 [Alphaproteobacteria bacterium]|nr:hypothetical protein [Alphaproteobacteria bacterium]|tara:strand:- start:259 stop:516 length:258 start_codon:yes stop_codon:yes gene_type:complete
MKNWEITVQWQRQYQLFLPQGYTRPSVYLVGGVKYLTLVQSEQYLVASEWADLSKAHPEVTAVLPQPKQQSDQPQAKTIAIHAWY